MALQKHPAHGQDKLLEINTEHLDDIAKFDLDTSGGLHHLAEFRSGKVTAEPNPRITTTHVEVEGGGKSIREGRRGDSRTKDRGICGRNELSDATHEPLGLTIGPGDLRLP